MFHRKGKLKGSNQSLIEEGTNNSPRRVKYFSVAKNKINLFNVSEHLVDICTMSTTRCGFTRTSTVVPYIKENFMLVDPEKSLRRRKRGSQVGKDDAKC